MIDCGADTHCTCDHGCCFCKRDKLPQLTHDEALDKLEQAYMRLGKAYFLGEPTLTAWREAKEAMAKWQRLT